MTSVGLSLFNYQDDARSSKHKIKINMFMVEVLTQEIEQSERQPPHKVLHFAT